MVSEPVRICTNVCVRVCVRARVVRFVTDRQTDAHTHAQTIQGHEGETTGQRSKTGSCVPNKCVCAHTRVRASYCVTYCVVRPRPTPHADMACQRECHQLWRPYYAPTQYSVDMACQRDACHSMVLLISNICCFILCAPAQ